MKLVQSSPTFDNQNCMFSVKTSYAYPLTDEIQSACNWSIDFSTWFAKMTIKQMVSAKYLIVFHKRLLVKPCGKESHGEDGRLFIFLTVRWKYQVGLNGNTGDI